MTHLNCKTETLSAQKYDVFISYSHKDEDWVEKVLWPRLEAELGYRWVTVDV